MPRVDAVSLHSHIRHVEWWWELHVLVGIPISRVDGSPDWRWSVLYLESTPSKCGMETNFGLNHERERERVRVLDHNNSFLRTFAHPSCVSAACNLCFATTTYQTTDRINHGQVAGLNAITKFHSSWRCCRPPCRECARKIAHASASFRGMKWHLFSMSACVTAGWSATLEMVSPLSAYPMHSATSQTNPHSVFVLVV